jgi:enolase
MSLSLKPNIESPDDFYQLLTDAQRDLSDEEANDMNARLVLVLANQIGSLSDLREAIEVTK